MKTHHILAVMALAAGVALQTMLAAMAADAVPMSSRQALNQVVHQIDVDGTSLQKVVEYLRAISGTNIVVDWKALEQVGVAKDAPISLRVRELTLRKMLQLVLSQASPNATLTYSIDNNVIEVTSQETLDKRLLTKVYIVDDLVMVNNQQQAPRINLANSTSGGGNGGGGGYGGSGGSTGGGSTGSLFSDTGNQNTQQQRQTSDQKGQELVDLIKAIVRPNIWNDAGGNSSIRYFAGKLIVTAPASVHEAIGGPVGNTAIRFGN